jgi:hypothetical protein
MRCVPVGHVIAPVRVRVRRSGMGRMVRGGRIGVSRVIALSRQAATVRMHVGAILAVIAIDMNRLGTG